MRSLVIVLLALAAVSAAPRTSQRIVGGSLTTINQYPDMVVLLYSFSNIGHVQDCGGVVLNNRSVLTAAHCLINDLVLARWRLRFGSTFANSGGVTQNTAQLILHPQYNRFTEDNDIAIMRSAGTISFTNVIQPARIGNYQIADNQVVWAAGWGRQWEGGPLSEQLRHVQVWTINQNVCAQRYSPHGRPITLNMLCTGWLDVGGRDACQGDSGGPVYHNGVVVGITSWGNGCARARYPGVNARVSRYTAWISQNA